MSDAIARAIIKLMDDDELLREFKDAVKSAHYSPMGRSSDFSTKDLENEIRRRMRGEKK